MTTYNIYHNGKYYDDIYYNGHFIDQVYIGKELVWEKESGKFQPTEMFGPVFFDGVDYVILDVCENYLSARYYIGNGEFSEPYHIQAVDKYTIIFTSADSGYLFFIEYKDNTSRNETRLVTFNRDDGVKRFIVKVSGALIGEQYIEYYHIRPCFLNGELYIGLWSGGNYGWQHYGIGCGVKKYDGSAVFTIPMTVYWGSPSQSIFLPMTTIDNICYGYYTTRIDDIDEDKSTWSHTLARTSDFVNIQALGGAIAGTGSESFTRRTGPYPYIFYGRYGYDIKNNALIEYKKRELVNYWGETHPDLSHGGSIYNSKTGKFHKITRFEDYPINRRNEILVYTGKMPHDDFTGYWEYEQVKISEEAYKSNLSAVCTEDGYIFLSQISTSVGILASNIDTFQHNERTRVRRARIEDFK